MLTVVPVAVAIMTPVPLMLMYICKKCSARWNKKKETISPLVDEKMTLSASTSVIEPNTIGTGNIK
jgi:heme/copper-type cytochrome/quinol oxidase subunit 2